MGSGSRAYRVKSGENKALAEWMSTETVLQKERGEMQLALWEKMAASQLVYEEKRYGLVQRNQISGLLNEQKAAPTITTVSVPESAEPNYGILGLLVFGAYLLSR